MEVVYALVIVAALCFGILIDRLFRSRNVNIDGIEIPGPKPWPLIGNVLDVNLRGLHLSAFRLAELYGPIFRIKLLGRNIVIINDADLERKAFASTKYGDIFNDRLYSFFYAPAIRRMRKGIKRCPCPSVRACVCLSVCLSVRSSIILVGTL